MSNPNTRSKRNPISTYFKSMKNSKALEPTSYFDSKLFRGKSAADISSHLHCLGDLDNLKNKKSLHGLTYSQLVKLIPGNMKAETSMKASKIYRTNAIPSSIKESYVCLNPEIIQESLPKKKEKHSLPSEQRQILIGRYLAQNETLQLRKPLNTLDHIWHETLSNAGTQDIQSHRIPTTLDKKEFVSISDLKDSQIHAYDLKESYRGSTNITRGEEDTGTRFKNESDIFGKRSMMNEGPCGATTKQMESLMNSLKDFYKLLSYSQQSYQKAQVQQEHLTNFVDTFIKEVEQIEKTPKQVNLSRLNICVASLQAKVEELTGERDLITEQLLKIRSLVGSNGSQQQSMIDDNRESPLKQLTSNAASLEISLYSRAGSVPYNILNKGPRVSMNNAEEDGDFRKTFETEGDFLSKDSHVINLLKIKTREIKDDVFKLQKERASSEERQKKTKIKFIKLRKTEESPEKIPKLQINNNESPKSQLSEKHEMSPLSRLSPPLNVFPLNEPTPREEEESEEVDSVIGEDKGALGGSGANIESSQIKRIRRLQDKIAKHQRNRSEAAGELHDMYSRALMQLEEKLGKKIREIKPFQKNVDEVYSSNSKLLTLQVSYCFENLASEITGMNKDFEAKGKQVLGEIAENYENLLNLNSSNILKLVSVKNIVMESMRKLKKMEKFCNKYTHYDLTDKTVRKNYDAKYQNFKNDLLRDRKTLLFLIEQFNHPISIYCIDSMQKPNAKDVLKLVDRSKALLKVLLNLERFPILEEDFNEKTTTSYNKCRVGGDMINSLKEFYQANGGVLPAEKYKGADDCIRELEKQHIRILALQNELTMLSSLNMFHDMVDKPLLTEKASKETRFKSERAKESAG